MAQIKMIAVKRHKYGTNWYNPGDEFNAKHRRDALILEAMKKAIIQLDHGAPPPDPAPAKKTITRKTSTKKSTTGAKSTVKKSTTAKKTESKKAPKPISGMTTKNMKAKRKDDDENDPAADKERGTYERRDLRAKD